MPGPLQTSPMYAERDNFVAKKRPTWSLLEQAAATDLYGSLSLSIASDLVSQLLVSFHVP